VGNNLTVNNGNTELVDTIINGTLDVYGSSTFLGNFTANNDATFTDPYFRLSNIPDSNPGTSGRIWRDPSNNTLKIVP
jgi:hypothetical protein